MSKLVIEVARLPEDWDAIEQIRRQVFVEEQGIDPELDFDGWDAGSQHLLARWQGKPVGTMRLRHVELTVKIERLAVLPGFRRLGIARKLMQVGLAVLNDRGIDVVQVHAQNYVQALYHQLGFEPEGEEFEEAGILHVKMKKQLRSQT